MNPWPRLRVQIKGGIHNVELGVGPFDFQRRRQDFVVQGQDRLEHAGSTGCCFRMADLRLDGAERAPLTGRAIRCLEHLRDAAKLRGVACAGACPVAFDKFDSAR